MSCEKDVKLDCKTIDMKVKNYRFLATNGKEGLSHYSTNSKRIYEKYRHFSITDLEEQISFARGR